MLRQIVSSQWFALIDMILVMVSGVVWMIRPDVGLWIILIALLPWGARLIAGKIPFRRTLFDWLILIFLITAWVGYWAAYDRTTAWNKVWLIVLAILLYYALSAQPKQNLGWISIILFCVGVGVSIYFFLTHDFTGNSGRIAFWWMQARPQFGWHAIHHGYISGIIVMTTPFIFYWFLEDRRPTSVLLNLFLLAGLGIVVGAFMLTFSRGIWLAIMGAVGVWAVWKILALSGFVKLPVTRLLFPVVVLIYLCAILVFVFIGPGRADQNPGESDFGRHTRSEIFERGAYFLADFPIMGGGLNSFPGLYSQYILVIPFYYFVNSYNTFLDVAIEQGSIAGLIFVFLYFGCVWFVARAIIMTHSPRIRTFSWLALFTLVIAIVHGMLYDYLYNGMGAILLFFPIGISMITILDTLGETGKHRSGFWPVLKWDNVQGTVLILAVGSLLIAMLALNIDRIKSTWYANLGAIQMDRAQLAGFPMGKWSGTEIVPSMGSAEASLLSSLQFDPANLTANHRLGLISMFRQDFQTASAYLEKAYKETPEHRGIIKSLGYCYVWLGELDKAQSLLARVPEAEDELNVYVWWWGTQGRPDLSVKAARQVSQLNTGQ